MGRMEEDTAVIAAPPRGTAREHILERAKHLFAARGYDGVSMNDIARETGVSKANVFHHFESKEGLYLAVIADIVAAAPKLPSLHSDGRCVIERFQEFAAEEVRHAGEDKSGVQLILKEIVSRNAQRSRVLAEQIFAGSFRRIVAHVEAEQKAGRLRADIDPAMAASVLRSIIAFYLLGSDVMRHLPDMNVADDPERYVRDAIDIVMRGMAAPAHATE